MPNAGTPPAASHNTPNNTNKIQSTRMANTPGLKTTAGQDRRTNFADATPGGGIHPTFCTFVDFGPGSSDFAFSICLPA
jgi:hypothetical protein